MEVRLLALRDGSRHRRIRGAISSTEENAADIFVKVVTKAVVHKLLPTTGVGELGKCIRAVLLTEET